MSRQTENSIIKLLENNGFSIHESDFLFGCYGTGKGQMYVMEESDADFCVYSLVAHNHITGHDYPIFPQYEKIAYLIFDPKLNTYIISEKATFNQLMDKRNHSFPYADLYGEYYHFSEDPDLEFFLKYGISAESWEYIEQEKASIGLLRYRHDEIQTLSNNKEQLHLYENAITVIDQKSDDLWVLQITTILGPGEIENLLFYFDHKPNQNEINKGLQIYSFCENPLEIYDCDHCGALVHWLDDPSMDLGHRLQMTSGELCSCCYHVTKNN